MFRISLKSLWAHKRRLVGTSLAVVLGIAFLAGTMVLGDTLKATFNDLFTNVNKGTDAVVRSASKIELNGDTQRPPIDATLVNRVRAVPGRGGGGARHQWLRRARRQERQARHEQRSAHLRRELARLDVAQPLPLGRGPRAHDERRGGDRQGPVQEGQARRGRYAPPCSCPSRCPYASSVSPSSAPPTARPGRRSPRSRRAGAQERILHSTSKINLVRIKGDVGPLRRATWPRGPEGPAPGTGGGHRCHGDQGAEGRHQQRLPRLLHHVPDRVRGDRPGGGVVQHLQHVHDHHGPANARVSACSGPSALLDVRCCGRCCSRPCSWVSSAR